MHDGTAWNEARGPGIIRLGLFRGPPVGEVPLQGEDDVRAKEQPAKAVHDELSQDAGDVNLDGHTRRIRAIQGRCNS
jgi:hypothetical protein